MNTGDPLNDTLGVERGLPRRFRFSDPYWEATRDRRLLIQYCTETGRYQFFPRPVSIFTGRPTTEWREVSGRGEVFTYTITRRGPGPFRGFEPYAVANVRLDEGVHIIGNLLGCQLSDIHIGMRVMPYWLPLTDGTHLLMFQPDSDDPPRAMCH
jgi:uncharacterized protein